MGEEGGGRNPEGVGAPDTRPEGWWLLVIVGTCGLAHTQAPPSPWRRLAVATVEVVRVGAGRPGVVRVGPAAFGLCMCVCVLERRISTSQLTSQTSCRILGWGGKQ